MGGVRGFVGLELAVAVVVARGQPGGFVEGVDHRGIDVDVVPTPRLAERHLGDEGARLEEAVDVHRLTQVGTPQGGDEHVGTQVAARHFGREPQPVAEARVEGPLIGDDDTRQPPLGDDEAVIVERQLGVGDEALHVELDEGVARRGMNLDTGAQQAVAQHALEVLGGLREGLKLEAVCLLRGRLRILDISLVGTVNHLAVGHIADDGADLAHLGPHDSIDVLTHIDSFSIYYVYFLSTKDVVMR